MTVKLACLYLFRAETRGNPDVFLQCTTRVIIGGWVSLEVVHQLGDGLFHLQRHGCHNMLRYTGRFSGHRYSCERWSGEWGRRRERMTTKKSNQRPSLFCKPLRRTISLSRSRCSISSFHKLNEGRADWNTSKCIKGPNLAVSDVPEHTVNHFNAFYIRCENRLKQQNL